jgi:hypothetical protein
MVILRMAWYHAPMQNIEHFNLYTAYILNVLLEAFPMPKALDAKEIAEAMKDIIPVDPQKQSDASNFVGYTLVWLSEYDFIGRRGEISPFRYVLTPKSLDRLNAVPSVLTAKKAETGDKSLGEALKSTTADLAKEVGKEAKRQAITQIVGEILGHAGRAFVGGEGVLNDV